MFQAIRAIIVADGDVPPRADLEAGWPGWDSSVDLVIAADGGYLRALALDLRPDLLVGDADSLPPGELERVRGDGVEVELSPVAKDESDTELALVAGLRRGARSVTILGALGGHRLEHALANIGLLAMPGLADCRVELLDARTRVSLLTAPDRDGRPVRRSLAGPAGDLVSLIPFGGDVEGVTTSGFEYPLADEPLRLGPARGLSNVRLELDAAVAVRSGRLLIVESHPVDSHPVDGRPSRAPQAAAGSVEGLEQPGKGVRP